MKILIAEDQPTAALFLRRNLEKMGHEVAIAPDGETAWQMIRHGEASVLISDWMMPNLDGLELCQRLRTTGCDRYIYIILLTSLDRREDRLQGLRAGADDFLTRMSWPSAWRSLSASWPSTTSWLSTICAWPSWPRPTS